MEVVDLSVKHCFPLGDPVGSADVVERANFIGELLHRLSNGEHVLLAGPRRSGKTTLAREALRRLRVRGYQTAYIDLGEVSSRDQFAQALSGALRKGCGPVRRTLQSARSLFASAARSIGEDLRPLGASARASCGVDPFLRSLDFPEQLAAADGRRVVIVIDAFQECLNLCEEADFSALRSRFRAQSYVSYLLVGSHDGAMQELFHHDVHDSHRFATPDIPPVAAEEWVSYMERKFRGRDLEPTPAALRHLVAMTGGHASDAMAVCEETLLAARAAVSTTISVDLVAVGYERALGRLRTAFEAAWNDLARGCLPGQALVLRIARGEHPYPVDRNSETVSRTLATLIRSSVLERFAGGYRFPEPMFAEYLRRRPHC